jgi:primosomal protein N' (replication factor Y)
MLADVLTAAANWHGASPLLTYLVPAALEGALSAGQLVAIPYGERLVEGIIWTIREHETPAAGAEDDYAPEALRPLHAILDPEPALLPHQMALAEWMAQHYVTPLSQTALMMLPPGLMQRSQVVLRLASEDVADTLASGDAQLEDARALRLRALVGLLLADGELNVERLKEMLGAKRARELLREARSSGLIAQDARLEAPRARARVKRIVRLAMQGDALEEWRQHTEHQAYIHAETTVGAGLVPAHANMSPAPGNVPAHRNIPAHKNTNLVSHVSARKGRSHIPDPWALPAATATLAPPDPASIEAQRQLAAVDLLQQSVSETSPWTPGMLCKASGLTRAQLQRMERAGIIVIETAEIRRNPLSGRALPASAPLTLTPDQQRALDCILDDSAGGIVARAVPRNNPPCTYSLARRDRQRQDRGLFASSGRDNRQGQARHRAGAGNRPHHPGRAARCGAFPRPRGDYPQRTQHR